MKALSLYQPWASLIATGAKKYETRSWATSYRGPLLICAAKMQLPWQTIEEVLYCQEVRDHFVASALCYPFKRGRVIEAKDLPLGKAVAVVDLVDCIQTETMNIAEIGLDAPLGDFSCGRFAWKLKNVRPIEEPFPVRGRQRLFEVEYKGVPK